MSKKTINISDNIIEIFNQPNKIKSMTVSKLDIYHIRVLVIYNNGHSETTDIFVENILWIFMLGDIVNFYGFDNLSTETSEHNNNIYYVFTRR